jgi:poly(3-hydroxybutyrate) depolymerase
MTVRTRAALVALTTAIAVGGPRDARGYSMLGYVWPEASMLYYINPVNMDVPAAAIEPAIRAAADAWSLQSGSSFRFAFAGLTTQTTNTNDGINVILFRNASSGSALATTYTWFSGSRIVDADTVFWDANFRFFTGSSGCAAGFYIEDVATHEFGHAVGLGHSSLQAATMYPSIGTCSQQDRTLDPDDIAAVLALYPAAARRPAPPTGLRIIR